MMQVHIAMPLAKEHISNHCAGRSAGRRIAWRSMIVLALLAGVVAAEAADPLAAGRELRNQGKFEAAAAAFRQVFEADSLQLEAHRLYQDCMIRAGKRAEAETLYGERAASEGSAINLYLQGRITEDHREATKILKKAIAAAPTFWRARACLAVVLAENDKQKDALKEAEEAVAAAAGESEPYAVRGWIHEQMGKTEQARADYERAIEIDPARASTQTSLGFLLESLGELGAAEAAHEIAVDKDPVGVASICALARLRHDQWLKKKGERATAGGGEEGGEEGKGEEGGEEGKGEEEKGEGKAEGGDAESSEGSSTSPGIELLRTGLKRLPDEAELHYTLGVLQGDDPETYEQAEASLNKAVELAPDEADFLVALGEHYLLIKKPSRANEIALQAVQKDRKSVEAYRLLARSFIGLETYDKAVDALGMAIKITPSDPDLHYLMGDCHERNQKWKEAIESFNTVARLDPKDPDPHARIGSIYDFARSDKKGALAAYKKYVELGGADSTIKTRIAELEKQ